MMPTSSRAEYYRRRGLEAQQRAARTTEEKIRDAFEDVAEGWFVLAEQMAQLDVKGQRDRSDLKRRKTSASETSGRGRWGGHCQCSARPGCRGWSGAARRLAPPATPASLAYRALTPDASINARR